MIKVILQNIMVKKAQESKQTHHFQSWHWEVKTFEKFEELSLLYSAHPRVSTAWGGRPRGHPVHFPSSIVEDICTALLGKLKRGKNKQSTSRLLWERPHQELWNEPPLEKLCNQFDFTTFKHILSYFQMPARRIKIASYKLPYKDWALNGHKLPQDLAPL